MDFSVVPPLTKMFLKIPLLIETLFPEIAITWAVWDWGSEPRIPLFAPKPGATARQSLPTPEISLDSPSLSDCLGIRGNLLPRDGEVPCGGCPALALPLLQLEWCTPELLLFFISWRGPNTGGDKTLQTSLRSGCYNAPSCPSITYPS